jgi:GT2 family glycosyltransferase
VEIELPYLNNIPRIPKVAIFTITYDRLSYTKKSFASLRKTVNYPFDHFVIDNGSSDKTVEYLNKEVEAGRIKQIKLNEKNEGISKASNDVVKMIKNHNRYDIVVKWDNDCIGLTNGWLAKMVEIWKSNHKMALSCYVQGLVDNPGGAARLAFGMIKNELIGVTKHLGGICHFVDIYGYDGFEWDENSFLHGVQDVEFSQWLQFHGYSMGYLENYFVSHGPLGSDQQKKDYPEYFERRIKEKQTKYEKSS